MTASLTVTTPETKREAVTVIIILIAASLGIFWLTAVVWNYLHADVSSFTDLITQWDSGWYTKIINSGYQEHPSTNMAVRGQANWAFFPLYPTLVWIVKTTVGVSAALAGLIVSNILRGVAAYYSYLYVAETRNRQTAITVVILLLLGPYSFYFATLYTESLYVALVAAGFYNLHHRNWVACGIVAALLSATRPTGTLFGIAILMTMFAGMTLTRHGVYDRVKEIVMDEERVLALCLVPLGIAIYMVYLYIHVGDALAFLHVQRAWGRSFGLPIITLIEAWQGSTEEQILALSGVGSIAVFGYLFYQRRYVETVFGLLSILIPLASSVDSIPRYAVGTVVLLFAIADVLQLNERYRFLVLLVATQFNVLLLYLWYSGANVVT